MVFAGDEIGLEGVLGEDSRRPMPWDSPTSWDSSTLSVYAALTRLRRTHEALRRGGLRWAHVSDDALVFLREHPSGSVVVSARRAAGGPVSVGPLALSSGECLLTSADAAPLVADGDHVVVPASLGPSFSVYAL